MRYLNLLIVLLVIQLSVSAQVKISGKVIDQETGELLPAATVVESATNGTITNMDGEFVLKVKNAGEKITLSFSYIGYTSQTKIFLKTSKSINAGTILLNSDALDIDEVVVKGKIPIAKQKGDTLAFNASAVKVHSDAKGLNLIKKLPGFSIKNDKIETQGEQVKKVFINGKPYFEDDPKNALNSLPANIIKNIELFDDYGEVASFTGYSSGSSVKAINIVTKPEYQNNVFGKLSGAYGTNDRYDMEGNLFFSNDKHDLSLVFENNNINKSNSDLSGFKSLEEQIMSKVSKDLVSQPQSFGEQSIISTGLNYNWEINDKTELSFNYTFGNVDKKLEQNRLQNYQDVHFYNYNDTSFTSTNLHKFSLKLTHQPSKFNKYILSHKSLFMNGNGSTFSEVSSLLDTLQTSNANTSLLSDNRQFSSTTMGIWLHNFGDSGRSLTAIGNLNLRGSDGELQLLSDVNKYYSSPDFGLLTSETKINQLENLSSNDNLAQFRVSYKEPLSMLSNLNFVVSSNYSWNNSEKMVNPFDEAIQAFGQPNNGLSSDISTTYYTNRAELGYSAFGLKLVFNAGVGFENLQMEQSETIPEISKKTSSKNYILPFVYGKYYISLDDNLVFFYRAKSSPPPTSQMMKFVNQVDPLQVTVGNPDLSAGTQHIAMLRYIHTNTEKSRYLSAFGFFKYGNDITSTQNYFLQEPTTIYGTDLTAGTKVVKPVSLDNFMNVIAGADYSFPLNFIRSNLNTSLKYSFNQIPTMVEDIELLARNQKMGANVALVSNISTKVDFNISADVAYNTASNDYNESKSDYLSKVFNADLNLEFWKGTKFNIEYNYTGFDYFGENPNQQYNLLNLSLGKSFLKNDKANVSIKMYDVLGQNKGIAFNFQDIYTESIVSNALQQHLMFSLSYKF